MTHPLDYLNSPKFEEQRKAYRVAITISPTHLVWVVIDMTGLSPGEALLGSKKITDQICLHESEYRTAISHDLLSIYNDSSGCKALKADEFKRRISLAEIKVNPANYGSVGCATLYYDEGIAPVGIHFHFHWTRVCLKNGNWAASALLPVRFVGLLLTVPFGQRDAGPNRAQPKCLAPVHFRFFRQTFSFNTV
jgi:hypothetical protein